MFAAENGRLACVKVLADLEKGMADDNGLTAKCYASSHKKRGCAEYLSRFPEECIDTSCMCKNLFDAAEKGCEQCCRRFSRQAGRTTDIIAFDGWNIEKNRTALMVAAYYGKAECVKLLAEKEAGM